MKLGITPWSRDGLNAQRISAEAEYAEFLGYDSFWVPEGHFQNKQIFASPLLLLAACSVNTRTIRLGTTSLLLTLRNPWLCAEETASLDQLSGGRLIVGVGRGFDREVLESFDVQPKYKRQLFEERLAKIKSAWRGENIPPHQRTLSPLPLQQPHPPIWASAFGPKALAQAGKLGMPYLASPLASNATLQSNFLLHEDAYSQAGHGACTLRAAMRIAYVSDDTARCATIRERVAARYEGDSNELPIGNTEEVLEKLQALQQRCGINYLIVTTLGLPALNDAQHKASLAALIGLTQNLVTQAP